MQNLLPQPTEDWPGLCVSGELLWMGFRRLLETTRATSVTPAAEHKGSKHVAMVRSDLMGWFLSMQAAPLGISDPFDGLTTGGHHDRALEAKGTYVLLW